MNSDRAIPDGMYQLGERELLTTILDNHRATLMWMRAGLTDDQLRLRAVEPVTVRCSAWYSARGRCAQPTRRETSMSRNSTTIRP